MKTPLLIVSILASTACSGVDFSEDEPDLDVCIQIGSVAGEGSNSYEIAYDLRRKASSMGGNHIVPANDSTDFSIVQTLPPSNIIVSRDVIDWERSRPAVPVQTSMVAYVYYCK